MATANEIFAATIEEPHIVIGSDRKIKVPDSLKRLGVQFDHNIETVTFDCPRYWDDHDMSEMAVYINYMLSNGYTDSYPADSVKADGDIMHFTWTISRNVTQVAGSINFLVCVKNTDGNGKEINHWNSELCQDAYISKGMENEEMGVLEQTDLITSLLLRMDSVEKINIKADAMQALLEETQAAAATAELVKEEALDASDYIKNSYANAIKGNVSGEVIRVDDVGPIQHTINTKVYGKNLFDISKVMNGKYITNNGDGTITVTTSESSSAVPIEVVLFKDLAPKIKAGKTYTITANSTGEHKHIWFNTKDTWVFGEAKVVTEEMLNSPIYMYASGDSTTAVISNIQIEEGTVATEYEPYIDPTTVTVTGCGKNICECNTLAAPNTSEIFCDYSVYITKPIVLSFKVSSDYAVSSQIWRANVSYADGTVYYINDQDLRVGSLYEKTFNGTKDNPITAIRIRNTYITAGELSNIQIELGETATDYEPYKGETYTPNQKGDVEVTSVSPTTTIFTNTPGVTIEVEYNRDTTKMFESYVLSEEAKNEIAGLVGDDFVRNTDKTNSITDTTDPSKVTTVKAVVDNLETFKEKEIDYTRLYKYDRGLLENTVIVGDDRAFKTFNNFQDAYKGDEYIGKMLYYYFDLAIAHIDPYGNITYLVDSPLKVQGVGTYASFINKNEIVDCGVLVDGEYVCMYERLSTGDLVENGTISFVRYTPGIFHSSGPSGTIIYLRSVIDMLIPDKEIAETLKEEFDGLIQYYNSFFILKQKHISEVDIREAPYLGGNG